MKVEDITVDYVENLMNECVDHLADDNINRGAQSLYDLKSIFKKAGMSAQAYKNLEKHIIDTAKERTSAYFIDEKLKIAQKDMAGGRIIVTVQ